MTCCPEPEPRMLSPVMAACASCGFTWKFGIQGKGKFRSKREKWGPTWFCKDDYDRGWRLRDYDRHEVVGTRRRGNRTEYVVGCPKELGVFTIDEQAPPEEAYCEFCDRSGLFGPMLKRYQAREKT